VYRDRISKRVTELDPEPQPDLRSIAARRSLDTADGIGSDPLEGVMQLIEDKFVCCGDSLRRGPYGVELALLFREGCGIRILQAAKDCSILRAGFRVTTRAGSRRLEIHSSGRASQEITKRIGGNEPATSDEDGPKLAFADQDVKRTA
jgi:hypothetical protein